MISSQGPKPRRARSPWAAMAGPGAATSTVALVLVDVSATVGLARVFSGHTWVVPVMGTVLAVHAVLWLSRRFETPLVVGLVAGLAATALMVSWTVFGSTTRHGLPLAGTWNHVVSAWNDIGNQFANSIAPVPPTRSLELLSAAGGGLAVLIADTAAFRWKAPLAGVLPALAVFVACCASGQGAGNWILAPLLAVTMGTFLMLEQRRSGETHVWLGGVHPVRRSAAGVALITAGVVAASLTAPLTRAPDGRGALGWKGPTGPGGGGERVVPSPLVSLQTQILDPNNTPVFLVDSPVPSYWRLTSLDHFDGTTWTSTDTYRSFGTTLPGNAPAGPGIRTVRATFRIQQLQSVWLPDQFNPVSVTGAHRVSYDPRSDSLLTSDATSDGQVYSVTSYQLLETLKADNLRAAPYPSGSTAQLNTVLPTSAEGAIAALAGQLTQGLTSSYDKALAIQTYLRSSRFRYTLKAPPDAGTSALYNFLFVTRAGYCQQFAGAFAVLARAAGVPTRIAVGFATGTPTSGGGYQVYDHDAHSWPEVYFGPRLGWVPFEPTPGFAVPGTSGYSRTSGSGTGTSQPGSTTTPTTVAAAGGHDSGVTTIPKSRTGVVPTTVTSGAPAHRAGTSWWWLVVAGVVAGVVGAGYSLVGIGSLRRRRRRRRAERAGTAAVVLECWGEVTDHLEMAGVRAAASETDDELARRAETALRGRTEPGQLTELAGLVRRSVFSADAGDGDAERARELSGEITRRIAESVNARVRLGEALRPGPRGRQRPPGRAQSSEGPPSRRRNRRDSSSMAPARSGAERPPRT